MKIAIAITSDNHVYQNNPCTAPKFAIYTINKDNIQISFSLTAVFDNPAFTQNAQTFSNEEISGTCSIERQQNFSHACEHYAMLDVIGGSSYLLADKCCKNTLKSLKNGGVSIYKIPTFIRDVHIAIKNFLIGANYANTLQHIHYAS